MEQGAVIRFLILKTLRAKDIQTELEQVSEDGVLEMRAIQNVDCVSYRGESTLEKTHSPKDWPGPIFLA
jgi:hypothetical protein